MASNQDGSSGGASREQHATAGSQDHKNRNSNRESESTPLEPKGGVSGQHARAGHPSHANEDSHYPNDHKQDSSSRHGGSSQQDAKTGSQSH